MALMQFETAEFCIHTCYIAAPLVKILPIHFENVLPYNAIDIIDHLLVKVAKVFLRTKLNVVMKLLNFQSLTYFWHLL